MKIDHLIVNISKKYQEKKEEKRFLEEGFFISPHGERVQEDLKSVIYLLETNTLNL